MKVLFLDESGDHSLNVIDPQYPVFVLGGVIVDLKARERRGFHPACTSGRDQVAAATNR